MIVVTTPTGQIGSRLLVKLLDAGARVRVIAREPERLPSSITFLSTVEVLKGSTDDTSVLSQALDGAESLFWVVPPASMQTEDIDEHYRRFTGAACQAIAATGVPRVVAVSSIGSGIAGDSGPISASHTMDAMIEATGVHYRSLVCGAFMENILRAVTSIYQRGMFTSTVTPDLRFPQVAAQDVAAAAATLLLDTGWHGQGTIALLGPRDLCYRDMAETITEVLDKSVHYQQLSQSAQKDRLMSIGATEAFARGMVNALSAINNGAYGAGVRTPKNTTPTTFRRWCDEYLRPACQA